MGSYIYFTLFCISFYFGLDLPWIGIFSLAFGYAWMISIEKGMNKAQEKSERIEREKEELRISNPALFKIECDKQEKRRSFIWNCFGWSVLILLAFVSLESALIFFFVGGLFFNWGAFLFTPIKDFFCGCEKEKFKNEVLVSLMVVKLQEEQLERERTFFNEMVEIKKQLDFDSSH